MQGKVLVQKYIEYFYDSQNTNERDLFLCKTYN